MNNKLGWKKKNNNIDNNNNIHKKWPYYLNLSSDYGGGYMGVREPRKELVSRSKENPTSFSFGEMLSNHY
jgi:hypothetical protein